MLRLITACRKGFHAPPGTVPASLMPVLLAVWIAFAPDLFAGDDGAALQVGRFSQGSLAGWEKKIFTGETGYELTQLEGRTVLKAGASASASGLFKKIRVDLTRYPYLTWEWRVEIPHPPLAETAKKGDDYAARVYLVKDGGLLFWNTIALNYVWSSSQEAGSVWPNAFAGKNVMLVALRSHDDPMSTWVREKRNVYEDFKTIFGREVKHIDAIAVMTDSDNSGGETAAFYGDIQFTAE